MVPSSAGGFSPVESAVRGSSAAVSDRPEDVLIESEEQLLAGQEPGMEGEVEAESERYGQNSFISRPNPS